MNPSPHFLKENGMTSKISSKTRRNSLGRRVVKGIHVQKITRDQMTDNRIVVWIQCLVFQAHFMEHGIAQFSANRFLIGNKK
jgi:hypothetical protein